MQTPGPLDRRPLSTAATLTAIGMGGFLDGIMFHQLRQFQNHLIRDIAFLASGMLLIGFGWAFIRAGSGDRETRGQHSAG